MKIKYELTVANKSIKGFIVRPDNSIPMEYMTDVLQAVAKKLACKNFYLTKDNILFGEKSGRNGFDVSFSAYRPSLNISG